MRAAFRYPIRLFYHVGRKAWEDHFQQRAAALAFFSLVNLFPVLVLFLFFVGNTPVYSEYLEATKKALADQFAAPGAHAVLEDLFQSLSGNLSALGSGTSGFLALLLLIALGTSLLLLVERYLNDIWRVGRAPRNLFVRLAMLWTGLTLLPLLLAFSFTLSARFSNLPVSVTRYGLPYALTVLVFFVLYKAVPAVHVRWRPALVAALGAGFLWEIAKLAVGAYVQGVFAKSLLGKVYGSVAFVPIAMVWMYYSWLIVLFGAELAYVLEHLEELHDEAKKTWLLRRGFAPLSCAGAIAVVGEIARAFRKGAATSAPELASQHNLHPDQVQLWVGLLLEDGTLVQSADGRLLPAKDPESIRLAPLARLYFDKLVAPLAAFSPTLARMAPREILQIQASYGEGTLKELVAPQGGEPHDAP